MSAIALKILYSFTNKTWVSVQNRSELNHFIDLPVVATFVVLITQRGEFTLFQLDWAVLEFSLGCETAG